MKSNSVAEKRTASYTKNCIEVFYLLNSTSALISYPVAELPEAVGESSFTQQSGDCHCVGDLPILDEVFSCGHSNYFGPEAPLTI